MPALPGLHRLAAEVATEADARQAEVLARVVLVLTGSPDCGFAKAKVRLAWVRRELAAVPRHDGTLGRPFICATGVQFNTLPDYNRYHALLTEGAALENNLEWHYVPCGTCEGCRTIETTNPSGPAESLCRPTAEPWRWAPVPIHKPVEGGPTPVRG